MAANPRLVAQDTWVFWDNVMTHVNAGTIVDIPEGHDLEAAYGGTDNLVDLGTGVSYVVAEPEQPQAPEPDADLLTPVTSPDFPPDDQQQAPPADVPPDTPPDTGST